MRKRSSFLFAAGLTRLFPRVDRARPSVRLSVPKERIGPERVGRYASSWFTCQIMRRNPDGRDVFDRVCYRRTAGLHVKYSTGPKWEYIALTRSVLTWSAMFTIIGRHASECSPVSSTHSGDAATFVPLPRCLRRKLVVQQRNIRQIKQSVPGPRRGTRRPPIDKGPRSPTDVARYGSSSQLGRPNPLWRRSEKKSGYVPRRELCVVHDVMGRGTIKA